MPEVIKGFNIELGLDTLGVDTGLKGLNRTMSRVNAEFSRSLSTFDRGERSISRYQTTIEGLTSKMEVQERVIEHNRKNHKSLSDQYENSRHALDKASKGVSDAEKAMEKLANSTDATTEDFVKAELALREAEEAFIAVNKEVDNNRKELDNAEIALTNAERNYNSLSKSVERYSKEMKDLYIEQEISNSMFTRMGDGLTTFGGHLESISSVTSRFGNFLTTRVTLPIVGLISTLGSAALVKGWQRLAGIDEARAKLDGLGHSAETVESVLESALDSVRGTAFGFSDAATIAASAIAAGINEGKELTRYLKLIGDTAAIAGIGLNEMGPIFNKITTQNKAYNGELQQIAERGIPIYQWLAEEAKVSGEDIFEMARKGEISSKMVLNAVEKNIGGAALTMGQKSLKAALDNTWAALGRVGAAFLDAGGKGEGFFGQLKPLLGDTIENLDKLGPTAEKWGREFGKATVTVIEKSKEAFEWFNNLDSSTKKLILKTAAFTLALGPTLSILGKVGGTVATLSKGLGTLSKWLGIKHGTAKGMQLFAQATKTASAEAVIATGTVGKMTGGLQGLVGKASTLIGVKSLGGLAPLLSGLTGPVGIATAALGTTLVGAFAYAYKESEGFKWIVDESVKSLGELVKALVNTEEYMVPFIDKTFKPLAQALEDTEEPMLTFTEQMNLMAEVLKIHGKSVFENMTSGLDEMKEELGDTSEVTYNFGKDVSKATAQVVVDYIKMSDDVRLALEEIRYNHRGNQEEQIEDLRTNYKTMHEEAMRLLKERHLEEYEEAKMHLADTYSLSEADKETTLNLIKEHHNNEKNELTDKYERVFEIIEDAQNTEDGMTVEHIEAIERMLSEHNVRTTENLSATEIEQEAIMQRMKTNQLKISEETVSGLIQDSIEAKDKVIEEAEKKRDASIAWAIDQHMNVGSISEQEMNDIIRDAELTYESSVRSAENKHNDVVSWATKQANQHGIIVDGETGQILSKWDLFKRNFNNILKNIGSMAWVRAKEIGSSIVNPIINALDSLVASFNKIPEALGVSFRLPYIGNRGRYSNGSQSGNQYTPIAAYSTGTNFHKGGPALVGDKGFGNRTGVGGSSTREIVELPNSKRYLVDGDVIFPDFPVGAKVYNNRDTEKELEKMGMGSGSFLSSIPEKVATYANNFTSMIANIYDYVTNPGRLITSLIDRIGIGGGTGSVAIAKGMFGVITEGLIEKAKNLFELATSTGDGSYILNRAITQRFGRYTGGIGFNGGNHYGLDTAHVYDALFSPINGVVTRIWNDYGGGKSIQIKSGRDTWWFMHLSNIMTRVGETIRAGMRIATTGNTGNFTTGAHLHTQLMRGGIGNAYAIDPLPTLKRLTGFIGSFENGGWINRHGFYEAGEGNKPEVVIPMTNRSRAIELMFEVMSYLTKNNNSSNPHPNVNSNDEVKELKQMVSLLAENNRLLTKILNKELNLDVNELNKHIKEADALEQLTAF